MMIMEQFMKNWMVLMKKMLMVTILVHIYRITHLHSNYNNSISYYNTNMMMVWISTTNNIIAFVNILLLLSFIFFLLKFIKIIKVFIVHPYLHSLV